MICQLVDSIPGDRQRVKAADIEQLAEDWKGRCSRAGDSRHTWRTAVEAGIRVGYNHRRATNTGGTVRGEGADGLGG